MKERRSSLRTGRDVRMFPLAWKGAGGLGKRGRQTDAGETEKISHKVKERNAGEMITAV